MYSTFSMDQNMKILKPNVCQRLYTEEYGQINPETPHRSGMAYNIFVSHTIHNSVQNKLSNRITDCHANPLRYVT